MRRMRGSRSWGWSGRRRGESSRRRSAVRRSSTQAQAFPILASRNGTSKQLMVVRPSGKAFRNEGKRDSPTGRERITHGHLLVFTDQCRNEIPIRVTISRIQIAIIISARFISRRTTKTCTARSSGKELKIST